MLPGSDSASLPDLGLGVEDRAYEATSDTRKLALIQSKRYLDQFGAWL